MKFSYQWIKELAGTDPGAQKAADLLTAKSFEVEAVEGDVMDVKILPNRPDCLSHLGLARELCALTGERFSAPAYEYKVADHTDLGVMIEDVDACPRYSALMVRGVHIGPSPDWLRDRVVACGLKSINNVVDVTNYVMLELGQPMHAFDAAHIDQIIVRHARAGETLRALDEARTEYPLDPSMLVIANGNGPLAIAGIKGGADSGITDATTDIFLEAANFDPSVIRVTSRKIGLRTDSSIRFAYGVDPNLTAAALVRAAELMAKVASGTPDRAITDVYPRHRVASHIMLDPHHVRSLLGVSIGDPQIRSILQSLGFDIADVDGKLNVTVPTRRLDVTTPEDLIEEVGRIYGYDAIPSAPPVLPMYDERAWVAEDAEGIAWDEYAFIHERQRIIHLLAGAGYSEVYNYAFVPDATKYELAQPLSSDYQWLRTSLVPRLLLNARDNLRFIDDIRLCETGHVFDHVDEKRESTRLGIVLARKSAKNELFYELKGTVDLLLERLGVADYYYDDADPMQWDEHAVNATTKGRRALIRLEGDGHVIGFIGAVSSLKAPTAVAELCLRSLIRHAQREREFEPLPKYPSVVRDIAMLVQAGTKVDDILQVAQGADDAGIVQDIDVIDIFLPTGKEKIKAEGDTPEYPSERFGRAGAKSVAIRVVYRADDHTLTDPEVTLIEDAIKKALQENLAAQIR